MDAADRRWIKFHALNQDKASGNEWPWWKCNPYNYRSLNGKLEQVEPKWHLLTSVRFVGERGDARYTAACGYEHTFKRIFIEKPRSVVRKPKLAELCINCSHSKL